jgi:hypothetical protein
MKRQTHTTNPTKRVPIDKSRVSISISPNPKTKLPGFFTVHSCDLSGLSLPDVAMVWLWAYTQYDEVHWDMGTVAAPKLPTAEPLKVEGTASRIQFRLDVFQEDDALLLGQSEGLKAVDSNNPDQVQSLFDTEALPLGNELWRLQLDEGQKPRLEINDDDQLQMNGHLDTDFLWRGLILPGAIRQTLLYLVKNPAEDDDPLHWQNKWKVWIKELDGSEIPAQNDDFIDDWVDAVVRHWVDGISLKERVIEEINGE